MATRKFTLFHFSMIPFVQTSMTMRLQDSREEWLRHALSSSFEFEHLGCTALHWVPQGSADECIIGLIQKTKTHDLHEPPERGGGEITKEEWQGAYVIIDPTHHDEGQRIAVENDEVGKPSALMRSLAKYLNKHDEAAYQIEIEPLWDSARFWSFAKSHGNLMKRIDFDFVVPNMWSTESDLDADLKDTGNVTGAERVSVGFRSEHGVSTDNQKIKEGVDYTERGAGSLTAKAMDGTRFSSTQTMLTSTIPAVKAKAGAMVNYFRDLKGTILQRGKNPPMDDSHGPSDSPPVG